MYHTAACTKCSEVWAGSYGDVVREAEGHETVTALAGDYHSCRVRVNGEEVPRMVWRAAFGWMLNISKTLADKIANGAL